MVPANDGEAPMDKLLLTINQCCWLAGIGRTKFYELVASGEIPVRKVGKKTLVTAADLKRWTDHLPAMAVSPLEKTKEKSSHKSTAR
jgi:excisionase family DNA binding protein